jgi:hypothetical protein
VSYHNTNDIEADLTRVLNSAKDSFGNTLWQAYKKAIQDAYDLGSKSGFKSGFQAGLKEKCDGNHS